MRHGGNGPAPVIDFEAFAKQLDGSKSDTQKEKQGNLIRILTDDVWREHCLNRVEQKFPAIVTYLCQLLAHDVTKSAKIDTRFDLPSSAPQDGPVNLRGRGLLLQTIYGEGMHLDRQLFQNTDENDRLPSPRFKMTSLNTGAPENSLLPAFWLPVYSGTPSRKLYPLVGDTRNADTPMLLWTTLEFMKFHNTLVDQNEIKDPNVKYFQARIRVILTWHNIIENEILPLVAGQRTQDPPSTESADTKDADLFHGLMRAFHTLPLNAYNLISNTGVGPGLSVLMSQVATIPEIPDTPKWGNSFEDALRHWHKNWQVNLTVLTDPDGPNLTCFTPSFASVFGTSRILSKDFAAANTFGVSPLKANAKLNQHAQDLLTEIAKRYPRTALPKVDDLPLSFGFLAETFFESKKNGALGSVGGSIFVAAIQALISRAERQLDQFVDATERARLKRALPRKFEEMRNYQSNQPLV